MRLTCISSKPEVLWRKAKSVDYYTAEVAADLLRVSAGTSNVTEFYRQWPRLKVRARLPAGAYILSMTKRSVTIDGVKITPLGRRLCQSDRNIIKSTTTIKNKKLNKNTASYQNGRLTRGNFRVLHWNSSQSVALVACKLQIKMAGMNRTPDRRR